MYRAEPLSEYLSGESKTSLCSSYRNKCSSKSFKYKISIERICTSQYYSCNQYQTTINIEESFKWFHSMYRLKCSSVLFYEEKALPTFYLFRFGGTYLKMRQEEGKEGKEKWYIMSPKMIIFISVQLGTNLKVFVKIIIIITIWNGIWTIWECIEFQICGILSSSSLAINNNDATKEGIFAAL